MTTKRLTDQEKIDVVTKYNAGLSSVQLSKEFGITHTAILSMLKRRGVKIKKNSDYNK